MSPDSPRTKNQKYVMRLIEDLTQKDSDKSLELLKGAYVVLAGDQGDTYQEIIKNPDLTVYTRTSSHFSKLQQYGANLKDHRGSLLAGINKTGDTWFQLERSAFGSGASFKESWSHLKDFIRYKLSGKNQGPEGSSNYVESKPLLLSRG